MTRNARNVRNIRGATRIVGLLLLTLATRPAPGDELRNVKVGQEVPPFSTSTLTREMLESMSLRGHVAIIVYVSAEQRSSEAVALRADAVARDFLDDGVRLAYLTADVTRLDYFRSLRDRDGLRAPLGLDIAREIYGALGLIVLPTTIVIDPEGRLAHVISSNTPDYDHVLRCYVRHALGQLDETQLTEQLAARAIVRNRPADRIARHRAAARLLRDSHLDDDAERELRAALEIDPADADTLLDLAALSIDVDRMDEGAGLVERALEAAPENRRAHFLAAIVQYRRGNLETAQRALEEALLRNTDPARAHYYLGLIAEQRHDTAGAAMHFKQAAERLLRDHP